MVFIPGGPDGGNSGQNSKDIRPMAHEAKGRLVFPHLTQPNHIGKILQLVDSTSVLPTESPFSDWVTGLNPLIDEVVSGGSERIHKEFGKSHPNLAYLFPGEGKWGGPIEIDIYRPVGVVNEKFRILIRGRQNNTILELVYGERDGVDKLNRIFISTPNNETSTNTKIQGNTETTVRFHSLETDTQDDIKAIPNIEVIQKREVIMKDGGYSIVYTQRANQEKPEITKAEFDFKNGDYQGSRQYRRPMNAFQSEKQKNQDKWVNEIASATPADNFEVLRDQHTIIPNFLKLLESFRVKEVYREPAVTAVS